MNESEQEQAQPRKVVMDVEDLSIVAAILRENPDFASFERGMSIKIFLDKAQAAYDRAVRRTQELEQVKRHATQPEPETEEQVEEEDEAVENDEDISQEEAHDGHATTMQKRKGEIPPQLRDHIAAVREVAKRKRDEAFAKEVERRRREGERVPTLPPLPPKPPVPPRPQAKKQAEAAEDADPFGEEEADEEF